MQRVRALLFARTLGCPPEIFWSRSITSIIKKAGDALASGRLRALDGLGDLGRRLDGGVPAAHGDQPGAEHPGCLGEPWYRYSRSCRRPTQTGNLRALRPISELHISTLHDEALEVPILVQRPPFTQVLATPQASVHSEPVPKRECGLCGSREVEAPSTSCGCALAFLSMLSALNAFGTQAPKPGKLLLLGSVPKVLSSWSSPGWQPAANHAAELLELICPFQRFRRSAIVGRQKEVGPNTPQVVENQTRATKTNSQCNSNCHDRPKLQQWLASASTTMTTTTVICSHTTSPDAHHHH